jgi:hypothetical protein
MSRFSSKWITFGEYVRLDRTTSTDELYPLAECLSYAITQYRSLDFYLEGAFTGIGPCGGDPGWQLFPISKYKGQPYIATAFPANPKDVK